MWMGTLAADRDTRQTASGSPTLADPCSFSPNPSHARALARSYAGRFKPGQRVLDIGCGQGHFLDAARERGIEGVGIDRDDSLVAASRDRGHEVHRGDVRELPEILAEPFDGALATHLIEHLNPEEVVALCADVAEMVRPGGAFVIATPNFRDMRVATDWFWLDPSHVRPYPEAALDQLIDKDQWRLVESGLEPTFLNRETPRVLVNRVRFGRHYGRPGSWYRLSRV
jgi:SAM-dependent methyltransferase